MVDFNYFSEKYNIFVNNFIDNLPNLILSIFIFVIFYIIAEYYKYNKIISKTGINAASELSEQQETNKNLIYYQINWIIYYSIILFGLILFFVNLGFNVAVIITIFASFGFGFSLSFQETMKSMISGIYIVMHKLFQIGDIIMIQSNLNENINIKTGKIIDFNLYYTTIINSDKEISMIPNVLIQNNVLTNITMSKKYF